MKVLITGGAGYIGSALVEALIQVSDVSSIVIYDSLERGRPDVFLRGLKSSKPVEFVRADVLDSRRLAAALEGVDMVYHLAARVSTPFSEGGAHLFEQVNQWGSAEVANAIEQSQVQKVVYLSSGSVYGAGDEEFDEVASCRPETHYGVSKLRGEQYFERLADKRQTVILRCGLVYGFGASSRFDTVVNKMVFDAKYHGLVHIKGDGLQLRPMVHLNSVSSALTQAMELASGTYNVVSGNYSILDVVQSIREGVPDLQVLYMDQQFKHRSLALKANAKTVDAQPHNFAADVQEMMAQLSF